MKIKKASELMWLFGTVFVALGVAICSKANLGVSMIAAPAFVIHGAASKLWQGFSVGMLEYLIQGALLVIMCLLIRRFRWSYLFAFIVAVAYGYVLNLFLFILAPLKFDAVWLRWLMLIVGDSITAFGVACFFRTYLPLQVYELFVSETVKRFGFGINKVKWCFDASLLLISVLLSVILYRNALSFDFAELFTESFHGLGLGTLVTTLINSPLIALMGRLIDKIFDTTPLFPSVKKFLVKE